MKERLLKTLDHMITGDVVVAFSGGVDSSVVLRGAMEVASKKGVQVTPVFFDTVLLTEEERQNAQSVAKACGKPLTLLKVDSLNIEEIQQNHSDRCYHCKKTMMTALKQIAKKYQNAIILEGSNQDDQKGYRPGLKALQESGILSPLAVAGLDKKAVRALAKEWGLSVAERPSTPCLATRFAYNNPIEETMLRRVERGENYLKKKGFPIVRLRVDGNDARIEIPIANFKAFFQEREAICTFLKEEGFSKVSLDLEGFRSGSQDERLKQ